MECLLINIYIYIIYIFIARIENGENPYPGLRLPVDYEFELNDIDIDEEDNDWDPINREFGSDFTITSLPDQQGYELVDVNRDELAYKSHVRLTGYCNAENDENNNLWVTMESPFLTKKITQKFPTLPGYTIPETPTRAIGDNEIEITTNGTYILGQNDEDPDDLEMDEEIPTNSNQQRSLTLSKTGTRDTTSTFTLGKFNINIPSPTITSPITSNGYYKFNGNTLIPGTNQDYNINVQVANNVVSINKITTGVNDDDISSSNGWTYYSNSTNITISAYYYTDITITKNSTNNTYDINIISAASSNFSYSVPSKSWVFHRYGTSDRVKLWNNNKMIYWLEEYTGDNDAYNMHISQEVMNFNGISWMTFN